MQAIVNGKPQKKLDGGDVLVSSQVEVQLIRNTEELVAKQSDLVSIWFFAQTKAITGDDRLINYFALNTTLTKISGTCSVPSQTVALPPTQARILAGVGTTAGERSFQININNCPKGYNKILYKLKPVGDTIENSPGVLPLSAESTAKGVKIKVTDSAGAAFVFDKSIQVDAYDKATGGSYSIPMHVSYVQTEANVTPGSVNGAVSVLMEYQ